MKQFEYMIEHKRHAMDSTQLDLYGTARWELVAVIPGVTYDSPMTYYFKREVAPS